MIKSRRSKQEYSFLFFILSLVMVLSFVSGGLSSSVASTPGTWEATSDMGTAREGHTVTLLPNGKVLIVGGQYDLLTGYLESAELYDPSTGTFTSTGSMLSARAGHTATLLSNGKVLITGGVAGTSRYASAEIYDPVTGSFSPTGSMAIARDMHTATLLPNGKVLIVGGCREGNGNCSLDLPELYNPVTGTFTTSGAGIFNRGGHTATLLPNGKVLISSGDAMLSDCGTLCLMPVVYLYDIATGTFSATGSMETTREIHTATLLPNGKVLIAGGINDTSGTLSSAELYDPATGIFSYTAGALGTARYSHTATLLPNGRVLIAGGFMNHGRAASSAELYDPATGTFIPTGSMLSARVGNTSAILLPNGKVLNVGGLTTTDVPDGWVIGILSSAELYCPSNDGGAFSPTGSMGTARGMHTATLLPNGKVLIAGGRNDALPYSLSSTELYDPATGTFSYTGFMGTARESHKATLLPNGKVLIAGGYNTTSGDLASAELYDPATGTFSPTGSMGIPRIAHTATLLPNGKVLIAGGCGNFSDGCALQTAELYDPATETFSFTGSMGYARANHTATLLYNGQVLITGGSDPATITTHSSAELYDPATGTFSFTEAMTTARSGHTATPLPGGYVLIAGGSMSGTGPLLASAEGYAMSGSSGFFYSAGSMGTARGGAATVLHNGHVLITGGGNIGGVYHFSAEEYSGSEGFSYTESMEIGRVGHTATLLPDGKVLIAGGENYQLGVTFSSAELYQSTSCEPKPDLLITSMTTNPVYPEPGQNVEVTITIRNQGDADAEGYAFWVGFYKDRLNPPVYYDYGDSFCVIYSLAAGATTTCVKPISFDKPSYDSAGIYNMWAQVDLVNNQYESNELNNIYGPQPIIVQSGAVPITIDTSPNAAYTVDGATYNIPQTFFWVPGSSHTIGTSSPQSGLTGVQYLFSSWSDGGAQTHTIITPAVTTTYTANFTTQYQLTTYLNPAGGGSVSPDCSSGCWYNSGTAVGVTATANTGYIFSSWGVACSGSGTCNVTMNAPKLVIANFSVLYPPVTITTVPAGQQITVDGSVYTSPQTFTWWAAGSIHTIGVSSPQGGGIGWIYAFSSWSDGGLQTHTITTPASATTYTANFTTQYKLTTAVYPSGSGSVSPDCSGGCWYNSGASVTLTATANSCYAFTGWSGACSGTGSCTVTVDAPKSAAANFYPPTVPITINTSPSGRQITIDGTNYTAPKTFNWTACEGHVISVSSPQIGTGVQYIFSSWSDGGAQMHPITTPSTATTYTAYFTTQYTLTTTASPTAGGSVSPSCGSGCWYNSGATVAVTATANTGYTFANWSGACTGTGACSVTMDAAKSVTANFSVVTTNVDLVVTVVTAPTTGLPGATITAGDTTKNNGPGNAPASTTKFYWSTNATWDAGDTLIGSRAVPALAALATSTGTTTVTVPLNACSGTFYIIARADADNVVAETIETNNNKSKSIKTGADLVISTVTAPATSGAGKTISVTDTTRNSGGCPAGASTTKIYLSTNSTWDALDTLIGSRAVPALAAGAADTGSTSVTIPAGASTGRLYIIARADADSAVSELSETNNNMSKSIKIGPDLTVYTLSAPASAVRGATITVTTAIKNIGGGDAGASTTKLYLSTNTVYDAGDTYLGERVVPNIVTGATNSGSTPVTISLGITAGAYYIIAVSDANTVVVETSETNNNKYKMITIN